MVVHHGKNYTVIREQFCSNTLDVISGVSIEEEHVGWEILARLVVVGLFAFGCAELNKDYITQIMRLGN